MEVLDLALSVQHWRRREEWSARLVVLRRGRELCLKQPVNEVVFVWLAHGSRECGERTTVVVVVAAEVGSTSLLASSGRLPVPVADERMRLAVV